MDQESHDTEPWCFTIVRAQGMRLMRPEKSWRPIVTVEVDRHNRHETVMGVDGQNPNLKETFRLHQVTALSQVDIRIWHRPQSKKKKKRNLVATASHTLSELLKKQEKQSQSPLEIQLQCHSPKCAHSTRARPQAGAILHMKIRPPTHIKQKLDEVLLPALEASESGYSSTDSEFSTTLPTSPTKSTSWHEDDDTLASSNSTITPGLRRRRKRIQAYAVDSCDEGVILSCTASPSGSDAEDSKPFLDDEPWPDDEPEVTEPRSIRARPPGLVGLSTGWIAASLLPQHRLMAFRQDSSKPSLPAYTEKIETPAELTLFRRILASLTVYSELSAATVDSQYEAIFGRLQMEWTYIGGLLVALAAVNTAVFSISPDSVFKVDSYARSAIAASSVASGLGIACDAWFLVRYNWADLNTLKNRALDVYSSYFFFALSARVPAICMFISAFALMSFLAVVAFDAWPGGVLVVCGGVGLVMTLQFLVYGVHLVGSGVLRGGRRVVRAGRGMVRAVGIGADVHAASTGEPS